MKVSLVIPTYNGRKRLPNLLKSVFAQTIHPQEVIVAVDGSNDDTWHYLCSLLHIYSKLKIIYQPNRGRASIRNAGAALATGDLLIFVDDDMILPRGYIESHICFHLQSGCSIASGFIAEFVRPSSSDFLRFKAFLSKRWNDAMQTVASSALPRDRLYFSAANCSLPKDIFKLLHGFDYRLTDAEDFDLAVRAHVANIPVHALQDAKAWHDDRTSCLRYISRLKEYAVAQQKLRSIKPELYQVYTQFSGFHPTGFKQFFFRLFVGKGWIRLVDSGLLAFICPKLIRFKLYDWIVTANGAVFI